MKKGIIFYFSGTGNTYWASEKLSQYLNKKNINVDTYSIEVIDIRSANKLIKIADLVGFAYPIYGSDLPYVMKDFMKKLDTFNQKKTFVICTQWKFSGDGVRVAGTYLENKGFTILWGEHFLMPNNVTVSFTWFLPYTTNQEKINKRLKKTDKRIKSFADKIIKGRTFKRGFNPISMCLGALQRIPFRKKFSQLRDDIGIDNNICINCDRCLKNCPVSNFKYSQQKIKTKGLCILCLRCYNFCPVSAITYRGKLHNNKRGKKYQGPVLDFKPENLRRG